jgi:hypothetical protein
MGALPGAREGRIYLLGGFGGAAPSARGAPARGLGVRVLNHGFPDGVGDDAGHDRPDEPDAHDDDDLAARPAVPGDEPLEASEFLDVIIGFGEREDLAVGGLGNALVPRFGVQTLLRSLRWHQIGIPFLPVCLGIGTFERSIVNMSGSFKNRT